ncbi:MAG: hypothetical protein ACRDPO_34360 [Streptosporangiaceae bacterium]
MSGPSASSGEMPRFSLPRGPASDLDDSDLDDSDLDDSDLDDSDLDDSDLDDSVLDMLLTGQPLPPDAPRQARMTADALTSLGDPQRPGALAGEAAARSAFARTAAAPATYSPATRLSGRRARPRRFVRVRPRLAAVLAALAISLGGTVAAAYAGVLPAPIQDFAHLTVGAPAPHHVAPRPDPGRHARLLCAGYQRAQAHGNPGAGAEQARKLARAAGGAGKINGYCASLGVPGAAQVHHGALGRGAKAHPGQAKAKALGKRNAAHRRNPHAHPKAPAEPKAQPKAHQPHAQPKTHA